MTPSQREKLAKKFGKHLRKLRLARGVGLRELARQCGLGDSGRSRAVRGMVGSPSQREP